MIGMHNSLQDVVGVVEVPRFGSAISASANKKDAIFSRSNEEPKSVLDKRSPSPSTSTSASSSAPAAAACGGAGGDGSKEEWVVEELQPLCFVGSEKFGVGFEDWDCFLSDSAACGGAGSDQSFLRWFSGEFDGNVLIGNNGSDDNSGNFLNSYCNDVSNAQDSHVSLINNNLGPKLPVFSFQEPEMKPQNFEFKVPVNQIPDRNLFVCNNEIQEEEFRPSKRQNSEVLNLCSGYPLPEVPLVGLSHGFLLGKHEDLAHVQKPLLVPKREMDSAGNVVYDLIYKAAEMIQTGQFSHAQMILARLNQHQLSQRAVSCFKEALMSPLLMPESTRIPSLLDFAFKIGAYNVFSEVSPVLHFSNFTANQAILEAVGDAECVHIFDFDIGFGAQWSSFMEELPKRSGGAVSLKITAFASPSTHHPIEISLMHESLSQFANNVGVRFELEVVNLDTFDPNSYPLSSFRSSESEVVAVNFPIWSVSSHLSALPSLLHFLKQLSPKIMVSLERGCERTELPFPHHVLNALRYYEVLWESIGGSRVNSEFANKIERFLFKPSIERIVQGRLVFPDHMPPWRALFASAGFLPMPFSGFTETQAECVAKRNLNRGFHVEKRQSSIVLCWQSRELLTAMAWRCE